MNAKEAREKFHYYEYPVNSRDHSLVSRGFLEAVEKIDPVIDAVVNLVDSIKWSGDINQCNLAPKISVLSQELGKYRRDVLGRR